jgi:hypothetical protein
MIRRWVKNQISVFDDEFSSYSDVGLRVNDFDISIILTEGYSPILWFNSQHIPAWFLAKSFEKFETSKLNMCKFIQLDSFPLNLRIKKVFLR